jgi:hypothetical protein
MVCHFSPAEYANGLWAQLRKNVLVVTQNCRLPKRIDVIYLFAILSPDFYCWVGCCTGG